MFVRSTAYFFKNSLKEIVAIDFIKSIKTAHQNSTKVIYGDFSHSLVWNSADDCAKLKIGFQSQTTWIMGRAKSVQRTVKETPGSLFSGQ